MDDRAWAAVVSYVWTLLSVALVWAGARARLSLLIRSLLPVCAAWIVFPGLAVAADREVAWKVPVAVSILSPIAFRVHRRMMDYFIDLRERYRE